MWKRLESVAICAGSRGRCCITESVRGHTGSGRQLSSVRQYEVVPGITVHACDNEERPGYHLISWSADKKADSRQTQNVQCRKRTVLELSRDYTRDIRRLIGQRHTSCLDSSMQDLRKPL